MIGGLILEQNNKLMFSKRALRRLIFPLIIEQMLALSIGLIDTIMISSLGDAAISGVSLVDMIVALIIDLFAAMATGGAVIAAQYIGAGDTKNARKSASQLIFIAFTISVIIMGIFIAFKKPILLFCFKSLESDVMASAVSYFWISSLSFPFIAVYNCCAALFRTMGNSKISMFAALITNVLNMIGNSIMIFGFKKGVAGAAAASTFSRFICMVFLLTLICSKSNTIYISFKERFKPDFKMIKNILNIAVPTSIESSLFNFGRILVVGVITPFGTMHIAANAVANSIDALGVIPGQAIALASITVIGQCVGAKNEYQIRLYTKKLIKLAYLAMVISNIVIILTLPLTLKLYNISANAYNLAVILVFIHSISAMLIWAPSFLMPNVLKAANDVTFVMLISMFSMFACRLVLSYIIGHVLGFGVIGVWFAMITDWIFRAVCFTIRYKGKRWIKYKIN